MATATKTTSAKAFIYNGRRIVTDAKRRFHRGQLVSYNRDDELGINDGLVLTAGIADYAVTSIKIDDGAIIAAKTSLASINPTDGTINANQVGTLQIVDGAVTSGKGNLALRGWTQTSVFSSASATQVNWGAGTFTASDGTSYAISAGNTGAMAAKTYIYLDIAISTTAYQITTTAANAVGNGKVLVAIAQNNTTEAVFQVMNNNAYNIDASNIVAGSITANEIATSAITTDKLSAGAVTAVKISTKNFVLSAGSFTNNSPSAGYVAWASCKVVYNGTEYTITNGNSNKKHIYWQLASPNVFAGSDTLPALGNDDFLVVFNNTGTALYVWNSTIINGNRITSGSVTATQIAANTITANEITTGEFITLSAQIKDAIITNAKITALDVGKLTAGTITVAANIGALSGSAGVIIDGANKRILVNDGTNDRILIGYLSGKF